MANGKFAVFIKGFAPNYSSSDTLTANKVVFDISDGTLNNRYVLYYNYNNKCFYMYKTIDSQYTSISLTPIFNKFQTINILVVQSSTNLDFYILVNGGVLLKTTKSSIDILEGSYTLRVGTNLNSGEQMDAFVDKVLMFDLDKLNRPNGFTDAEAEALLRGNAVQYDVDKQLIVPYENLFKKENMVLHPQASWDGDILIINPTAIYQSSYLTLTAYPNNKYELKAILTGANNSSHIAVSEYNGNVLVKNNTIIFDSVNTSLSFITNANTNKIQLSFRNRTLDICTFSDISFKLKM